MSDKKWYVVYCRAQQEQIARDQLQCQGFDVYLPCYQKWLRHARQSREIKAPLFPRYLFVSFDIACDRWRVINSTKGVVGLVKFNHENPIAISDAVIQQLCATENDAGLVSLAALELFKRGEPVRIAEGAFAGHVAVYQKMTDQQRAEILIHFLHQDVRLQLPVSAVEKIA